MDEILSYCLLIDKCSRVIVSDCSHYRKRKFACSRDVQTQSVFCFQSTADKTFILFLSFGRKGSSLSIKFYTFVLVLSYQTYFWFCSQIHELIRMFILWAVIQNITIISLKVEHHSFVMLIRQQVIELMELTYRNCDIFTNVVV